MLAVCLVWVGGFAWGNVEVCYGKGVGLAEVYFDFLQFYEVLSKCRIDGEFGESK